MKAIIERKSNGIHDCITIQIEEPRLMDLPVIQEIMEVVQRYNDKQIEEA